VPNWIPLSGITPQPPSRDLMLGMASAFGFIFEQLSLGPLNGLGFMTLYVFGLVVLRRRWLATGFIVLISMMLFAGDLAEAYAITVPLTILMGVVFALVVTRSGILSVSVVLVVGPFLATAPFTLELSRWYAGRGIVIVATILALAGWAFWTSLGGRRALGFVKLEEA